MFLLRLFLTLLVGFAAMPQAALARSGDMVDYREAFAALDEGRYQVVQGVLSRGPDAVLNDVLRAAMMARPGNEYSFEELSAFIADHADWPGLRGIYMIAEQKIPADATPQQIVNWFTARPPLTQSGFIRYMDALNDVRRSQDEAALVRERWINHDLSASETLAFRARYQPLLTAAEDRARLDRLLWQGNATAARAMYPYVGPGLAALAEARLALAGQAKNAEALTAKVPAALRQDAGLLYEKLRWHRKRDEDAAAMAILQQAPDKLGDPEAWWEERNIMIRRAMERHDYKRAYQLAKNHRLTNGQDYLQAEFLAGWLALRFLNHPAQARVHFEAMLTEASTPISRARGHYWLGRTLESLKDSNAARESYENAAALNLTFYGQLAQTRLVADPILRAPTEPAIPQNVRNAFFKRSSAMATERLMKIGQTDRARSFHKAALDAATQRVTFVLLMEQAYKLQRPDWAIMAAKAANQKNMVVAAQAYPLLTLRIPSPPDPAFTYALIRQESLFNTDARSPVGARGLMQLMPRTAKDVAKKEGVVFRESRLNDPDYNINLGTSYAQAQIDGFNGSYILALAGYNAGPRRVREWLEIWGDPRSPRLDPIDWIELIPISETRNYVQRIIENLQIYRARLNNGEAPLQILADLKR